MTPCYKRFQNFENLKIRRFFFPHPFEWILLWTPTKLQLLIGLLDYAQIQCEQEKNVQKILFLHSLIESKKIMFLMIFLKISPNLFFIFFLPRKDYNFISRIFNLMDDWVDFAWVNALVFCRESSIFYFFTDLVLHILSDYLYLDKLSKYLLLDVVKISTKKLLSRILGKSIYISVHIYPRNPQEI